MLRVLSGAEVQEGRSGRKAGRDGSKRRQGQGREERRGEEKEERRGVEWSGKWRREASSEERRRGEKKRRGEEERRTRQLPIIIMSLQTTASTSESLGG